jgi:YgiT-type zinc finger domain-containing protein
MIPDKCSLCEGNLHKNKTDFVVKVGNEIISINNVPAYICDNCGEAYYEPQDSRKIDKIMKEFHSKNFLAHPIAAGEVDFNTIAA